MTRAWVLSGGGAKGAFSAGVVQKLLENDPTLDFQYAIGTSTGSLIAGPALLGDTDYLANAYTTMANSDILDNSLIGSIIGMPISASMEPLHHQLIDYFLHYGKLDQLLNSGKTQVVTCVNIRTGKVHHISSEMVRNDLIAPTTFIKAIVASCSVPLLTRPVAVFSDEKQSPYRHDLFCDGGVKEFLPFEHAIRLGVDEVWGVSTHRLHAAETAWGGGESQPRVGVIKLLNWTIGALFDEVARGDRYKADVMFKQSKVISEIRKHGEQLGLNENQIAALLQSPQEAFPMATDLKKLYLIYPSEPMGSSLQFDATTMMGYLREGRRVAERFLALGQPEFHDDTLAPWDHQVVWPSGGHDFH